MKVKSALLWFFGVMLFLTGFFGLFTYGWTGIFLIILGIFLIPLFKKKLNLKTRYQVIVCALSFVFFGVLAPSATETSIVDAPLSSVAASTSQIASSIASNIENPSSISVSPEVVLSSEASISSSQTASEPITVSTVPTELNKNLTVHYIDVGQADSILIELPNSQTMLIDGGNRADSTTVTNYLRNNGITTIDYLVATHPHEDHIGGLPAVIDSFEIESIYMPRVSATTQIFEDLLTSIDNKGLSINTAQSGVNIVSIPNLQIDIVAPNGSNYADLNDWSAVIKMQYKDTSFLFAGDAETVSESEITANIDVDVLKVGHHGSKSSTSVSFLQKVTPSYAIISVGKDNTYGHPDEITLATLDNNGVNVYRTDEQGTIIITSDGSNIRVNQEPTPYQPNAPPASTIESSSTSQPESSQPQSITVYVTNTGSKYHRDGCRYLSKSKISISLDDAKRSYGACSVCNPPQ